MNTSAKAQDEGPSGQSPAPGGTGETERRMAAPDALLVLCPGQRIDHYEILELLGRGGFGEVYRAKDVKLGREVALKFLANPMNEDQRRLFEREAQALARLSKHPNIVEVHAWGEAGRHCYFVLEYVPLSLDALLRKHPEGLSAGQALSIALECAEALEEAHSSGVLHRDIKPSNILLESEEGPAKIADFGLARLMDSPDCSGIGNAISGSPPYMSPEQANGEPVDHRTDIYSLGATLYEMLCGSRPYAGDSGNAIVLAVREGCYVPLSSRRPNLHPSVVRIVDKAMAHQKDQRYETAGDFADDIMRALFERSK